ncbi:MAG TPA: TIGR04282 family arsenosugar biosynthesis glycosyltransferase [Saprospiraceae bacterium]|nr:TIGR04282 family arsenosugar biosynthesis glycosyltransferase [Saprospiraceae bacterium]
MKGNRTQNALIVFCKNLIEGEVKTRLATDIGHKASLEVYTQLQDHTFQQIPFHLFDVHVFYHRYIEDLMSKYDYKITEKHIQQGKDLGEKMKNAFEKINHDQRYGIKMIIGTDCPFIHEGIFEEAVQSLSHVDYVIGPALDGGYYLLGTKDLPDSIFENMPWSTGQLLSSTIDNLKVRNKTVHLLTPLPDIDTLEDLNRYWNKNCLE